MEIYVVFDFIVFLAGEISSISIKGSLGDGWMLNVTSEQPRGDGEKKRVKSHNKKIWIVVVIWWRLSGFPNRLLIVGCVVRH